MRYLPVRPDPWQLVWHYANGRMPDFVNGKEGDVGWVAWDHRGIQPLDDIRIPDGQKRYVFSKKFELRFDTAFEEVVRGSADLGRFGKTWVTPELVEGLIAMHRLGYAHSYEAWTTDDSTPIGKGQLAGGVWGVQIGSFVTASSMFNRVSNATKAAYGRALLHLKERGFTWVDTGMVPEHAVNYGSRYVPRWQFEEKLRELVSTPRTIVEGLAAPALPKGMAWRMAAGRVMRGVGRRLGMGA
ncbi:MAG: leucyl/phenylalanyl-tRNA--protein transferase [Phycisphaerae bacterium]|nr:leucyl/phenylalanyl-tRNA--protein transferase [Tepidisphaeraceae bacterium]